MSSYNEGTYDCTVMGQGYGYAGENQTPYFGIEILPHTCFEGGSEFAVDSPFTRTVKLWMNSEANVDRSKEQLTGMGWEGSFKDLEPGGDCDLTGKTVRLVDKHTTSPDGKVWDGFEFPFKGTPETTISNDNSIAAKLDRLYKTTKKAVASTVTEEDTPF